MGAMPVLLDRVLESVVVGDPLHTTVVLGGAMLAAMGQFPTGGRNRIKRRIIYARPGDEQKKRTHYGYNRYYIVLGKFQNYSLDNYSK